MEPENLRNASPSLRNLFFVLRKNIKSFGYVREKVCTGRYYCFYAGLKSSTKFVEIESLPTKNCLSIIAKTGNLLDDDKRFAHLVPENRKWGKCKIFRIDEESQLTVAICLIREAYELFR